MFKNYLKISWRSLVRDKVYSSINILGLAIGLSVCMLIMLYVAHEYSYDMFHKNSDRIYFAETELSIGENKIFTYMKHSDVEKMKQHTSIESILQYRLELNDVILENNERPSLKFAESKFMFADSTFFNFFSFKLERGDKDHVLKDPFSLVLSKKMAKKYFGEENPIGKILRYNNLYDFTVTGVSENTPSNSSIEYDFLASTSSMLKMDGQKSYLDENERALTTCLQLDKIADASLVASNLSKDLNESKSDFSSAQGVSLKPLKNLHLQSATSNLRYIKVFPFVAALILLLAILNYAGLSTARSTIRSKEIGVRKVMGASRKAIATQFFMESALYTTIAFVLGYFLCSLSQALFFDLLQIRVEPSFLYSPIMLLSLTALFVISIFLASVYPSMLLSAFKPVKALYARFESGNKGFGVRKFFMVFQFSISIILIICSIVIDRQMFFFRHTNTGVDRENVVMMPFDKGVGEHLQSFKQNIQELPTVKQTSTSVLKMYKGYNMFSAKTKDADEHVMLLSQNVDQHFIPMLNLKWKNPPLDSLYYKGRRAAIVNEALVQRMGIDGDPIGYKLTEGLEIKGVLKDFNHRSLQNKIEPLCLEVEEDISPNAYWSQSKMGYVYLKIKPNVNMPSVINQLKDIYNKYESEKPFEYQFLNEAYEAQYKAEDRLAKIFSGFTLFAILIAVLGLFGLVTFLVLQRRKEIGIRKVLGASVRNVVIMISKDFLNLVLIAMVIASPVAYWFMTKWLHNFAYKIAMGWWMFAMGGVLAIIIALTTVSFQALKAAIANPVKSLRTE